MSKRIACKVAVVSDALAARNGVGTYYLDLAEHLVERLDRFEVFCPCLEDPRDHQGPALPLPGDPTQKVCLPKYRKLKAQLTELNPDVVIVPIPGPYGFAGIRIARKLGAKVCIGFHTDYARIAEVYWNPAFAKIMVGVLHLAHKLFFRSADMVATLNKQMRAYAEEMGVERARSVGTPILKSLLDEPKPVPESVKTLISLCRLAPEKNLGAYMDAAASHPDQIFVVYGDGPLRGEIERFAESHSNLDYRGWIPREQVRDAIDGADVLVLPSLVEGFGTVIVEALARRRLVMASSNCQIDDWRAVTESIHRIAPGETVSDALDRLLAQDPETLMQRAEAGRRAAVAMNERAVDDWLEVFADLTGTPITEATGQESAA